MNMNATLLIFKMCIFVTTFRNGMVFVLSESDWLSVWRKMNTPSYPNINYKSNCPWEYVLDSQGNMVAKLLSFAKPNCIDLTKSNRTHVVHNLNGQCQEIIVNSNCLPNRRQIVGYTCIYAASRPTEKRNEQEKPNNDNLDELFRRTPDPKVSTTEQKGTTRKYPYTDKNENEKDVDLKEEHKEQNDKYTTEIHQYLAPPFLNNPQFKQPPFLDGNVNQFQPRFLSGMSAQMGEPPLLRPFDMVNNYNGDRNAEVTLTENKKEQNSKEQNNTEETVKP